MFVRNYVKNKYLQKRQNRKRPNTYAMQYICNAINMQYVCNAQWETLLGV